MPVLCIMLLTACQPAERSAPHFKVTDLEGTAARLDQGQTLGARAELDLRLSDAAHTALQRGVPLTLRIQSRVRPDRGWSLFTPLETDDAWELRYEALSEHYTLTLLTHEDAPEESFPRLRYALARLHEQSFTYPAAALEPGDYQLGVRVILDVHRLPTPMRLPALIESDWQLNSDWKEWPFRVNG